MQRDDLADLTQALGKQRRLFHYFPDRYALLLLAYAVGDGTPVRRLKASRLARLLCKPGVREVASRAADGVLSAADLMNVWPRQTEAYRLTLDWWGTDHDWCACCTQTSRPGFNLVLQCNLSRKHEEAYRKLLRPQGNPFMLRSHPNASTESTLAWARLDVDLDAGEVLIEEIQSDWVKEANALRCSLSGCPNDELAEVLADWGLDAEAWKVTRYMDTVFAPHASWWSELMLSATLDFVRSELGIRSVYYHSYDSARHFKTERWNAPRSLYSRLPERFCFEQSEVPPRLLSECSNNYVRCKLRQRCVAFYRLEL